MGLIDPRVTRTAFIETIRGCRFNCSFCDWGGKQRILFDNEHVKSIIKKCLDDGFPLIAFLDSIFGDKAERQAELLRYLVEHVTEDTKFAFEIYLEMMDSECIKQMRNLAQRGAVAKIEIGLQSADSQTVRRSNRPQNLKKFVQRYHALVEYLPKIRDVVQIDLIIGLPDETMESFGRGLNLVYSLDPGVISVFPLDVFPGSDLWSQKSLLSITAFDQPPYNLISTPTMSLHEIEFLTRLAWSLQDLRLQFRDTISVLNHVVDGGIFQFMCDYLKHSKMAYSAYDPKLIGIEQFLDFAQFAADRSTRFAVSDQLAVKQHLLFDLAPAALLSGRLREIEYLFASDSCGAWSQLAHRNELLVEFDSLLDVDSVRQTASTCGRRALHRGALSVVLQAQRVGCKRTVLDRDGALAVTRAFPSFPMLRAWGMERQPSGDRAGIEAGCADSEQEARCVS
ncbi:radical SAM protein [Bradyrhizobium barranii subsp. apii]|uniref:Radical SAM protein n=1 Tax=Bradyrhizobium barranii subsp. apii TaxID=2819348 RepID=A0A8T5VGS5_9BRAD|nr:radical SAM protein [Bradyrhizobium barranii]UPT89229.1 radical SAM protein [Bradyrhizobium barranii subsp. apii]